MPAMKPDALVLLLCDGPRSHRSAGPAGSPTGVCLQKLASTDLDGAPGCPDRMTFW